MWLKEKYIWHFQLDNLPGKFLISYINLKNLFVSVFPLAPFSS